MAGHVAFKNEHRAFSASSIVMIKQFAQAVISSANVGRVNEKQLDELEFGRTCFIQIMLLELDF